MGERQSSESALACQQKRAAYKPDAILLRMGTKGTASATQTHNTAFIEKLKT
jgi:hypothetical protein